MIAGGENPEAVWEGAAFQGVGLYPPLAKEGPGGGVACCAGRHPNPAGEEARVVHPHCL